MTETGENEQRTTWLVDEANPELGAKIRGALAGVIDPEIGMSVVELGLVRQLEVSETEARVTMILTTPFCPFGPAIMEQTRRKVAEATGLTASMQMGSEMWDQSMMEGGAGADWRLY
jgi:metal-sulfur cluster biosynthetic enzyme